jgi:isochorismate synthase
MQENELIFCIDKVLKEAIPFALWSLPGSSEWEGIAQKNKELKVYTDPSQHGFVIAKFNNSSDISFINADLSIEELLTYNYSSEKEEQPYFDLPKETSKAEYLLQCKALIQKIKEGKADKVVLSRVKKAILKDHPATLFLKLCEAYPQAMVFLYQHDGQLWIGASPEILLSIKGDKFRSMALAGSMAVDDKSDWTLKEYEEQAYVEDYIEQLFRKRNIDFEKEGPMNSVAGPVKHLLTKFNGRLQEEQIIELLKELHPTPAVCGIPVVKAKNIIRETEAYDRLDYSGFFGPVNQHTKDLFVNLRSALISDDTICLFLGGGITKDSNAEAEWEETELKAKTLLSIL